MSSCNVRVLSGQVSGVDSPLTVTYEQRRTKDRKYQSERQKEGEEKTSKHQGRCW